MKCLPSKRQLVLTGLQLFGSMSNPRIRLTPSTWTFLNQISSTPPADPYSEKESLSNPDWRHAFPTLQFPTLGKLPAVLQEPELHYDEIQQAYVLAGADIEKLSHRLSTLRSSSPIQSRLHRDHLAAASLALAIAIGLNQILEAFNPLDTTLSNDLLLYHEKITQLANDALIYRPLGTGFMAGCLSLAWASATDTAKKSSIRKLQSQCLQGLGGDGYTKMADWWHYKFMAIRCRLGNPKPNDSPDEAARQIAKRVSCVQCNASHNYLEASF
jgi:hypothetical protein